MRSEVRPITMRVQQGSEFVISDYAALFLNGTFGWAAFMYMNLPEGGPGFRGDRARSL
jgi:hypothetical protein